MDASGSAYVVSTDAALNFPTTSDKIQGPQAPLALLLKSIDGAVHFNPATIPASASAVQGIAIDPVNPQTVYVGTNQNGIWKSLDGGGSFAQTGLAGQYSRPFVDPNDHSVVYAATGNGLLKSVSGGAFSPTALTSNVVLGVAFDSSTNPSTVYAATGQYAVVPGSSGQVFKSTDGGVTFPAMPGVSVAAVNGVAFK